MLATKALPAEASDPVFPLRSNTGTPSPAHAPAVVSIMSIGTVGSFSSLVSRERVSLQNTLLRDGIACSRCSFRRFSATGLWPRSRRTLRFGTAACILWRSRPGQTSSDSQKADVGGIWPSQTLGCSVANRICGQCTLKTAIVSGGFRVSTGRLPPPGWPLSCAHKAISQPSASVPPKQR